MSSDVPEAIPAPKPRGSRAALVLAALAMVALAAGLIITLNAGEGQVENIRVTKHSMLPESFVGTPDYYLVVGTRDGKSIETEAYSDMPIGNGLDFKLPKRLDLADMTHIELMDKDMASDDIRDRVDVRDRLCRGQDYEFALLGPPPPRRNIGYALLSGGGALLVVAAILLVRSHAV